MRNLPQATRSNEFSFRLTSHALVAVMLTCAVFTLLSLIDRLLPGWQPLYLPVLCFLGVVERLITYRPFVRLALFSQEWLVAMLSEWAVIILLIKLVTGLAGGMGAFVAEIRRWGIGFPRNFLTFDFVFTLALVAIIWLVSGTFAGLLNEMDLTQALRLEIDPGQHWGGESRQRRWNGSLGRRRNGSAGESRRGHRRGTRRHHGNGG